MSIHLPSRRLLQHQSARQLQGDSCPPCIWSVAMCFTPLLARAYSPRCSVTRPSIQGRLGQGKVQGWTLDPSVPRLSRVFQPRSRHADDVECHLTLPPHRTAQALRKAQAPEHPPASYTDWSPPLRHELYSVNGPISLVSCQLAPHHVFAHQPIELVAGAPKPRQPHSSNPRPCQEASGPQ